MNNKKLIAGNWKMNGLKEDVALLDALVKGVKSLDETKFQMVVCPPFTMTAVACELTKDSSIKVGGQDCHTKDSGAYTGNVSAEMLEELGAEFVILGHSERRQYEKETDALVAEKADTALKQGLTPIVCVGEVLEDREAGKALDVVAAQVKASLPKAGNGDTVVIAYEPVWAIGTGKSATPADVKEMHDSIAKVAEDMGYAGVAILYGGSVKPETAEEILAIDSVGGVLVGGASLKADSFLAIASAS
ncbi:MAG: triose-phosphate isomerase [Alphaproteobacteria bacterium]|jgi:triosephosphate isomerase|nr:triose-phosphate isomerase [Alphaproteobacteria bacterium]